MKAIVTGELVIEGNLKLVFGGPAIATKVYVKEDGDWQRLKFVTGLTLRLRQPYDAIDVDIEYSAVIGDGELVVEEKQPERAGGYR